MFNLELDPEPKFNVKSDPDLKKLNYRSTTLPT
jgi:hypothetical protein